MMSWGVVTFFVGFFSLFHACRIFIGTFAMAGFISDAGGDPEFPLDGDFFFRKMRNSRSIFDCCTVSLPPLALILLSGSINSTVEQVWF